MMEKEVKELEINNEKKISIDIIDLRSGIYFIKLSSDYNVSITKFIKE